MAGFMMKMERLIVINKKNINSAIIFCLLLSTSVNAKILYSDNDLDQYNKYHSCQKCDLSGASLEGQEKSILDGSILISSILNGNFTGSSFVGSILTQVNSYSLKAMVSDFSEARCNYAKFYKASFSGANFQNADLSKVNFKAANLSSADFTKASLKGANLDFSILIGAKLTQEQLKSAKSYYCAVLPDGTLAPPEYQSHNCIDRW
jgi:uncharacterized protein YjbI with pentapeptide repeats